MSSFVGHFRDAGGKKVTSVLSTTGLKQNLQKLAIKVYLCSVGPIQGSPGGRHEGAQESVPVLFVKVCGGPGRNTWASQTTGARL